MNRNMFPLGKAYGSAFCNRISETKLLVGNINSSKHTLLIAPRRYGKSSLAEKAIQQAGFPSVKANFHLCTTEAEVAALIKSCALNLIGSTLGAVKTIVPLLQKFLKTLHPRVSFFKDIATLELVSESTENYAETIAETLLMLDGVLREKNKKAVMFLDEFQEIANISESYALEGAIRTAAQEMENVVLIFSGSIRSLLVSMFENENRPLYKVCRKIHLTRIASVDYEKHLQKIAVNTWGKKLSEEALQAILTLSNRHPYFLNYLCDTVWQLFESLPSAVDVKIAWQQVLQEEWSDAVREISVLPMVQRRLMKYIAEEHPLKPMDRVNSTALKLSPSSISAALTALVGKDYIERQENGGYEIINPLLEAALKNADAA